VHAGRCIARAMQSNEEKKKKKKKKKKGEPYIKVFDLPQLPNRSAGSEFLYGGKSEKRAKSPCQRQAYSSRRRGGGWMGDLY